MTEEEISSTGQFAALSGIDGAASYQTINTAPPPSVSSTRAATASAGSATAESAARPPKPPTSAEIATAVATANSNLASANRQLDYRVDAATGISIAFIRDSQTGVVLQQIPGADILALARMLANWSPGKHMLLDLIA